MKNSCSSISELLERYFDQEVTSEERSHVEGHLADCRTCRAALTAMEGLKYLIKAPVREADQKESSLGMAKDRKENQLKEKPSWRETVRRWIDVTQCAGRESGFLRRLWSRSFLALAPSFFMKVLLSDSICCRICGKSELQRNGL